MIRLLFLCLLCLTTPALAEGLNTLYVGPKSAEIASSDTRRLSVPHRSDRQLSAWLSEVIPESLTYRHDQINAHYRDIAVIFTPSGLTAYRTYLLAHPLWQRMLTEKSGLMAISTGRPALLNHGVVNNTYKWLYDIPVTLSLIAPNTETLRKAKPPTATLIIRVQLTRVADPQKNASVTDAGSLVQIETWTVTQLTGPTPQKPDANRPETR